jgi:predicted pyridoxine 5'-phosphate oxidase superfamily flavin-nucleotide-binding protein
MARPFADITFTLPVKAAQQRYGSRRMNQRFEEMEGTPDLIGPSELAFIEARDGFYQATANSEGWPYVQFRGGRRGFLKVLDDHTIGYADFRGNVQYISVGNLADNDRVALILMDYANQRRLKIWGRARHILLKQLQDPTYRAKVERAIVITVEAMDWNCPQHITPRYTEAEVHAAVQPLQDRIRELEALVAEKP